MNLNSVENFGYFSSSFNSVNSSRIPRLISYSSGNFQSINNNKVHEKEFWQKFKDLNLNGKHSKIPVKSSSTLSNSLINYQRSGSSTKPLNLNIKSGNNLQESESESKQIDSRVKLRSVRGRSCLSDTCDGRTKSDPIDYQSIALREVLEIVRSNISADKKFRAIKRYRDKRLAIISQMNSNYSDSNCDERVREWVDSGYITNTDSVSQAEEVFTSNQIKTESTADTSQSLPNSQPLWNRRRSYNNMRAMDLIALNNKYSSFNSDVSMSSISSIESLLESRREDPEELLLALGFGYVSEDNRQPLSRIPQRFLESPSSAKGVNLELLRKSNGLIDSISGSTSFSPTDVRERSYSTGRMSDRFRNRIGSKDSLLKLDLPEIVTSNTSLGSPQSESILNPANRKFLENQGKQEDSNRLSSKMLIIGTKSYKLDIDGDPLAFPKTPSPVATTPVPPDQEMDDLESNNEQNSSNNSDDNLSESCKRKLYYRQKCVSDHDLDKTNIISSINDLSSELSSSTATLVGTTISTTNETAANDLSNNNLMISVKCDAFSQTENQLQENNANQAIEASFVVAIQSLRLSLEFYRHQSIKSAKVMAQKYQQSVNEFTDEDLNRLSAITKLRENIHKELIDMDTVLNIHLNGLQTTNTLETSFQSQAQLFTEAIKKMTELLKELHHISEAD